MVDGIYITPTSHPPVRCEETLSSRRYLPISKPLQVHYIIAAERTGYFAGIAGELL
jgi:hypothetical protein